MKIEPTLNSSSFAEAAKGSNIAVSSQDVYSKESGAFTGEVSGSLLKDAGASYAIIAHSERRQFFGETNESANDVVPSQTQCRRGDACSNAKEHPNRRPKG